MLILSETRHEAENTDNKYQENEVKVLLTEVLLAISCTTQHPSLTALPILLPSFIFLPKTHHSVTQYLLHISSSLLLSVSSTKCSLRREGFGVFSFIAVSPAVDDRQCPPYLQSSPEVCQLFQLSVRW